MPPQTRRMSFPKVVIERDTDSEESSSDEEEIGEEEDDVVEEDEVVKLVDNEEEEEKSAVKMKKAPITISLKKVCKVSFLP